MFIIKCLIFKHRLKVDKYQINMKKRNQNIHITECRKLFLMHYNRHLTLILMIILFSSSILPFAQGHGHSPTNDEIDWNMTLGPYRKRAKSLDFDNMGIYYDFEINSSHKINVYIFKKTDFNKTDFNQSNFEEAELHKEIKKDEFKWEIPEEGGNFSFVIYNDNQENVTVDCYGIEKNEWPSADPNQSWGPSPPILSDQWFNKHSEKILIVLLVLVTAFTIFGIYYYKKNKE